MGEALLMPLHGQIMMTYRCTAACRHCLVMASPGQNGALVSVEDAVRYGLDFQKLGREVIIAGGEALIFFDHVVAMARALLGAGVSVYFVESNASWCTSEERVREGLMRLKEAGVRGMYFSLDAYHQEFVPAERVCRAVRIAEDVFGKELVFAPRATQEQARKLEDVTHDPERLREYVRGGKIHFIGRAALELAQFAEPVPLERLMEMDCREELDVDRLKEIQVDPFGFVRPDWCPGVNLGNARYAPLATLARTEQVMRNPLLRGIAEHGPCSLLSLAQKYGFRPRSAYASKCHICFEIRRALVAQMPTEFGPRQVYEVYNPKVGAS